jgi:hypothetical protein
LGHQLTVQLKEMHSRKVLHTDLRITNILSFELHSPEADAIVSADPSTRYRTCCITDLDCAIVRQPDQRGIVDMSNQIDLDISTPGGRRDLILHLFHLRGKKKVDMVGWNIVNDFLMLNYSIREILSGPIVHPARRTLFLGASGTPVVATASDIDAAAVDSSVPPAIDNDVDSTPLPVSATAVDAGCDY